MKLIVLSDIHANLSAIRAVITDFTEKYAADAIAILGDIVDYGPHPNLVISTLESLTLRRLCFQMIWPVFHRTGDGNHCCIPNLF